MVPEPHVLKELQGPRHVGIDSKKTSASSTDMLRTSPMVFPFQRTASVSGLKRRAAAGLARDLHVGEERHLDRAEAHARTVGAGPFGTVEGEASGPEAPRSCASGDCAKRSRIA